MNQQFQYDTELKLGQNRGKPRIWIEGKKLAEAGFLPGTRFIAVFADGKIGLYPSTEHGDRWLLWMQRDSDAPRITRQEIEYSDFPLEQMKLYACRNELGGVTIMLPNEY